ncbi:MAG: ATP-binding protein [Armatimonadota bacterium]
MALPTEKTKIKSDIRDLVTLLYGQPKIGKSKFCSHADGALFLATEPGLNHLEVFQMPVSSWPEFLSVCSDIAKGNHNYRTIVIDTIDNLFKYCRDYVLNKHGLLHEQDAGYGKGYDLVKNEFHKRLMALSLLPYGLIMVSHAEEKEVKGRAKTEIKIFPTLPKSARQIVLGMSDLILYAEIEEVYDEQNAVTGYKPVIRTKPTSCYEAGDRTGSLPDTLPLDYEALTEALRAGAVQTDPTSTSVSKS